MRAGIYKITIGRWFYYGQTNNFRRRKNEHLRHLKLGKHPNIILQRAFDKHQLFDFRECAYENNADLLTELEQLVIDEWFGKDYCANLNSQAAVPPSAGFTGKTHSKETKEKLSVAATGKKLPERSEEHKAKLREARARQVITEETKAKLSAASKLYWERKRQENVNG